jgi:hypothetical protein
MPLFSSPMKDAELEHRLTRIEGGQRAIFWAVAAGGLATAWSTFRLGNRVGVQNGRITKLEQREDSHEQEVKDRRAWPRLDALERDVGDLKQLALVTTKVDELEQELAAVVGKEGPIVTLQTSVESLESDARLAKWIFGAGALIASSPLALKALEMLSQ